MLINELKDISPYFAIESKADLFRNGYFEQLDLFDTQKTALEILADNNVSELLFGGSAGGGKSFCGCEWLLWSCLAYPETRWFIGRRHLNEIRKSTVVTFRKVCKKHGIPANWWKYNDNSVSIRFENGSVIEGLELMQKPGDPDFDNFGSTEYTGGWIEEGGGVPVKAYEVLKTRIGRHYNDRYRIPAKMFITCNPSKNWLYNLFYAPWKKGAMEPFRAFVRSSVMDNTKRESGYLERLQTLTGAIRARLLQGDWEYNDDPLSLIEFDAIGDLFTNDYIKPDEKRRLICDIALHGSDLFRWGVFYGEVLVEAGKMEKSGGAQVVSRIKEVQTRHQIRAANVLYDADGVGGFIGQKGGFIPGAIAFHGNAAPLKPKRESVSEYGNLKAQCGYLLAEKINDGRMWARAVTSEEDRELLSEELAQIKMAKEEGDDKKRLRRKELIIKDLGRSPDFSDLFLMKQYFDIADSLKRVAPGRDVR